MGTGLLAAGLLPLPAFAATGEVFRLAAAGSDIPGLSGVDLDDLGSAVCGAGPQAAAVLLIGLVAVLEFARLRHLSRPDRTIARSDARHRIGPVTHHENGPNPSATAGITLKHDNQ